MLLSLYSKGFFSTIYEALDGKTDNSVSANTYLADRRLNAWCDATTAGDQSQFLQMLDGRGLQHDTVLRKLGEQHLTLHPPPNWLNVLIDTINASTPELRSLSAEEIHDHVRPFGYITESFTRSAEALRDATLSRTVLERFLPEARFNLREHLCDRIETVFAAPLYHSFRDWVKSLGSDTEAMHSKYSAVGAIDVSHREFLNDFLVHGLDRLWIERPALARILGNVLEQWIASTRELILRFDSSQQELRVFVASCPQNLVVEGVRIGLSDLHNGGRSVCVLSLQGGGALVYKPRSVSTEFAWERFVEWIGERLPSTKLKPMRVLDCQGYGWCEFVEGPADVDDDQAQAFFHRAGILLGLLHLLAATDMHEENLVACGEHPVLVDLEMLLQPEIRKKTPAGAEPLRANFRARDLIADSILETGLLPMIVKTPETATIGQGGLSHHALFGPRRLSWVHVNRFEMTPRLEAGSRLPLFNLPKVHGVPARLPDHWDAFKRGAEAGLRLALLHKSDLLRPGGPLEWFKGIPIRIILRPTRYYEMLLQRLLDFRTMSDTQTWSCQADFSARFEFSPDQPIWPEEFSKRERVDLISLNVPHFEVASDVRLELDWDAPGSSEQSFVSGYDRVRARVAQLDEASIKQQLSILQLSALAFDREGCERINLRLGSSPRRTADAESASGADTDGRLFRDEIQRIAELLKRSAIRDCGGCTWLGLTPVGDTDAIALRPLGHALYDGTAGVALFLAAASVAVEDRECRTLCLEAIAATRWYFRHESAAGFARTLGMGGVSGIGSVVYALTSIARILSAPELLEDALEASRFITERMIAGDRTFDITKGSAGTLLALLRLHAETLDRSALGRAIDCAEHLLSHRPQQEHALWKRNREPAALAGMSHGASGYALAFHRLHRATGDARYLQVVRDCLEYERSVFSREKRNWPDLRPTELKEPAEYPVRWCHGAVGIAFAREELIEGGCEDASLILEYRVARETSRMFEGHRNDSLCCGNFGAIALLMRPCVDGVVEASGRHVDRLLTDLIRQAREQGSYKWQGGQDDHNPGLFRGISGVGYIIARRLIGDALPNVLTLS